MYGITSSLVGSRAEILPNICEKKGCKGLLNEVKCEVKTPDGEWYRDTCLQCKTCGEIWRNQGNVRVIEP